MGPHIVRVLCGAGSLGRASHGFGVPAAKIPGAARHDVLAVIDDYRRRLVPLSVPVTLLRHHVKGRDVPYVRDQVFFAPHPKELGLRNHVA